jgi:hypothetical protein
MHANCLISSIGPFGAATLHCANMTNRPSLFMHAKSTRRDLRCVVRLGNSWAMKALLAKKIDK